jgi:3D (Asp-Asp-Asp) domain-containing protein
LKILQACQYVGEKLPENQLLETQSFPLSVKTAAIFPCKTRLRELALAVSLLLLLLPLTLSSRADTGSEFPRIYAGAVLKVRTTAYNHEESDHVKFGKLNARGYELRGDSNGIKSAAADWSRYPVGTKFQIISTGEIYEVDDYGIALTGTKTLDLYMPTMKAMKEWGARHEQVRILAVGSYGRSLALLGVARQYDYIKQMRADVVKRLRVDRDRSRAAATASSGPRPRGMPPPIDRNAVLSRKPGAVNSASIQARKPR